MVKPPVTSPSGAAPHEKTDHASVTSPIDAPPQRFQLRKHPGNLAIELTPSATGQTSSPICLLKLPSPIDSTPRLLKLPTVVSWNINVFDSIFI
ncbi:hypothetical protein L2E82_27163 [Cichorium intybus]|uniref:Uncharacterized protein n=1 Tax=Cichorium intybus TaxID=13427 RepID=A0ACB9CS51_CICIN|nr:hypothetical protein L2E82_27163 [Cichorium intybus]